MAKQTFEWRHVDGGMPVDDDDWNRIEAYDSHDAAKAAADKHDSDERMMIRSGHSEDFDIRSPDGAVQRYRVRGETESVYYPWPIG